MLSGKLWPAHPKPLPDELLSSWIVRVAEANGVKLETMTHLLFGLYNLPWNHDIDRLAPAWLLKGICAHTGISYWDARRLTLAGYRTRLFPYRKNSGQLRWILPVQINSTKRDGFGMQYCPACLAADKAPYFRRKWRVALYTFCPEHKIMLHDCCPACGAAVMYYRRDFGRPIDESGEICLCHQCQFDFRLAPQQAIIGIDNVTIDLYIAMLHSIDLPAGKTGQFNLGFFAVLHQLCKVMQSNRNHDQLRQYVAKLAGFIVKSLPHDRTSFEYLRMTDRHQSVLFALWLLADPETRIRDAWQAKVVRFNLLLKDFNDPPQWYKALVNQFNRVKHPIIERIRVERAKLDAEKKALGRKSRELA